MSVSQSVVVSSQSVPSQSVGEGKFCSTEVACQKKVPSHFGVSHTPLFGFLP